MPGLVFVHGIGGIRRDDEELPVWSGALLDGAKAAGHSRFADAVAAGGGPPIRFANYSDLFQSAGGQGGRDDLDAAEARILHGLVLESIDIHVEADHEESTIRRLEDARAQLDPTGEAQGILDPFRRTINAVTTLLSVLPLRAGGQWLTAKLMLGHLAQVARYLARSEWNADGHSLDERIRDRLAASLTDQPSVVVAHSLGTVVALETLHAHAGPLDLFVTLGSPIALRSAVLPRLVPNPPATPAGVGRWRNFWDRDDIIAARPILEDTVQANAAGVKPESDRIDSDGLWVHTATKYLSQPGVAGPVIECLRGGDAA